MADITVRLIWYRLNELYNTTSTRLTRLDMNQVDILDLIFVAWCLIGILAAVTINFVYDLMHPRETQKQPERRKEAELVNAPPPMQHLQQQPHQHQEEILELGKPQLLRQNGPMSAISEQQEEPARAPQPRAETCDWLNTVVAWLFHNSGGSPALLEAWLSALNYALAKERQRFDGRALVFEEIVMGKLPPEIVSVHGAHGQDMRNMELLLNVKASEIRLRVRLSEQEVCDVILTDIEAQVSADLRLCPDGFKGSLRLVARPKLRSEVTKTARSEDAAATKHRRASRPSSLMLGGSSNAWVAEVVISAVSEAVTEVLLSEGDRGSQSNCRLSGFVGVGGHQQQQPEAVTAAAAAAVATVKDAACQTVGLPPPAPAAQVAQVATKKSVQQHHQSQPQEMTQQPQPQASSIGSVPATVRLLVKLIKATGLVPHPGTGGSGPTVPQNPYACVELDEPYQRHVTGSVYGSSNPYWDQHYMLDLTPRSARLSLHVFDRRGQSDVLLGSAALLLADLPAQGARVIQPLRLPRRESSATAPSSTVQQQQQPPTLTAEFLFVNAAAAAAVVGAEVRRFSGPRVPSEDSVVSAELTTAAAAGVGQKAASTDQIIDQQQPQQSQKQRTGQGTINSSLSRTVDEFMKSADVSYQPMSSTDSAASHVLHEATAAPPAEHDHKHGGSVAGSADVKHDEPLYVTVETLVVPAWPVKRAQNPSIITVDDEDIGRKSKGNKPGRSSGSFASRFRRVFSRSARQKHHQSKLQLQQQQQQQQHLHQHQPHQARSPSMDQVFLPSTSDSLGARHSLRDGSSNDAVEAPEIYPAPPSDTEQQQQPLRSRTPDQKRRSLSSSLRRLFSSGRKKKRQRAESESRSPHHAPRRDNRGISGRGGMAAWNSEEIL